MAENEGLPIEVGLAKAKTDIVKTVSEIGRKYSLPSSLMVMILSEIVTESKLNTFETIVTNYDISQLDHDETETAEG